MTFDLYIVTNIIFIISGTLFAGWLLLVYNIYFKRDKHYHEDSLGINRRTSRTMYLNCGKTPPMRTYD